MATTDDWLPGLQNKTPQEGLDLAVKLARHTIVDHALARMERGLVDQLQVDGPENPDIYRPSGALGE